MDQLRELAEIDVGIPGAIFDSHSATAAEPRREDTGCDVWGARTGANSRGRGYAGCDPGGCRGGAAWKG